MKKRRVMPKKILMMLAAVLVVLGAWGISGVYASLKDTDAVSNSLGISDLTGNIVEEFEPPTTTNPATPGSIHKKKVTIKNNSTTPFFVRVLVTPEILSDTGTLLASNIGQELVIDIQPEWLLGEDGYYYYLGKVASQQETPPLFTQVALADTLPESYKEASLAIEVKSETVGSAKYLYQDAWWQPNPPTQPNLLIVDQTLKGLAD